MDTWEDAGHLIKDCILNQYTSDLSSLLHEDQAQQTLMALRDTLTDIPNATAVYLETVAAAPDDPAFLEFLIRGVQRLLANPERPSPESKYLGITARVLELTACVVERLPHHFSLCTNVTSGVVFKVRQSWMTSRPC